MKGLSTAVNLFYEQGTRISINIPRTRMNRKTMKKNKIKKYPTRDNQQMTSKEKMMNKMEQVTNPMNKKKDTRENHCINTCNFRPTDSKHNAHIVLHKALSTPKEVYSNLRWEKYMATMA